MVHRLFFAINIPDHIRQELVQCQKHWHRYPVRWTRPESLHFTVLFLGNVDAEQLAMLQECAGATLRNFRSFTIRLIEITLGPPHRLPNMVWAVGVADPEPAAATLSTALLQIARAAGIVPPNAARPLQLHLTLGRAKGPHLKGTPIAADLDAVFAVDRIDLMESTLTAEGPDYRLIESFQAF